MKEKPLNLDLIYVSYNNDTEINFLHNQITKFSHIVNNVIVIDNGSADNTYDKLQEYLGSIKNIKVIKIEKNVHYGGAIKKALTICESDFISWMNGDSSISDDFFLDAKKIIDSNDPNIFIKGKRKSRRVLEVVVTSLLNIYTSLVLKNFYSDVSAFPTIISKSVKQNIIESGFDDYTFELSAYHLSHKLKYRIFKIPVSYTTAYDNESTWTRDFKGYWNMSKIWRKSILLLKNSQND